MDGGAGDFDYVFQIFGIAQRHQLESVNQYKCEKVHSHSKTYGEGHTGQRGRPQME